MCPEDKVDTKTGDCAELNDWLDNVNWSDV
jgi:hypothetical protein